MSLPLFNAFVVFGAVGEKPSELPVKPVFEWRDVIQYHTFYELEFQVGKPKYSITNCINHASIGIFLQFILLTISFG